MLLITNVIKASVTSLLAGALLYSSAANAQEDAELLAVLSGGQIGGVWDKPISAWDGALDYGVCVGNNGAGCPTVSWDWSYAEERGQVLRASWVDNGFSAGVFFESSAPRDLTRFSGGTIEFDIRTLGSPRAVVMKIDCIYPCASAEWVSPAPIGQSWERVIIPINSLVSTGLVLSQVTTGLVFWPAGGPAEATLEIDNILWRADSGYEPPPSAGDDTVNFDNLNGGENTSPTSYPGMTLAWSDEFEGTSLKSQLWNHDIGGWGWGNNESQYYRPDNTSIQEGHLVITAKEEAFGGKSYTSSRIKTEGSRTFTYGRVDIRAALPRGQGIWPALWALGENFADVGWPYSGEIDIMEMIGGQGREAEVHGTVHWNRGGLGAPYSHTYIGGKTRKAVGDFADGFNVFSLVRTEDQIEWYVNDELYYSFAINDSADLAPFRKPFFLIFNIAVGGNWPGYPDASTQFPQQLVVDYVRVFQVAPPSPPAVPSGLMVEGVTHDTVSLSWADNADNEDAFVIERNGQVLAQTVNANVLEFTDTGLTGSTSYTYRVKARNAAGDSPWSNQAEAITEEPPLTQTIRVNSETTVAGRITAESYLVTFEGDGLSEIIRERRSEGKPRNRYSYLDHRWVLSAPAGLAQLDITGFADASGDGDSFELFYSTGAGFNFICTLETGSPAPCSVDFDHPGGNVIIRVTDTDQTPGNKVLESVSIDEIKMLIDSTGGPSLPPAAPTGLSADSSQPGVITLFWTDEADNESSYKIERSENSGATWVNMAVLSADTTTWDDNSVASLSTYLYRVSASNGYGEATSGSIEVTSAEIVEPNIILTATAYSQASLNYVDLSWDTGNERIKVRRNGQRIYAGRDGQYTDSLGAATGVFNYQACPGPVVPPDTTGCSDVITVEF